MNAVFLLTIAIKRQGVILQGKSALGGRNLLPPFDFGIEKLFDATTLKAYQVIVMLALIELKHRLSGLEIGSFEQTRLLELGQNTVDGGQPDIFIDRNQLTIDVLGTHVTLATGVKDIENLEPRQRGLQTGILQICGVGHKAGYR